MEEIKPNTRASITTDIGVILIAVNLLIPVSSVRNTINSEMSLFASIFLLFIVCYLNFCRKVKLNKTQLYYDMAYIFLLAVFSGLTVMSNPGLKFKSGELLKYLILFLLLNLQPLKKGHPQFVIRVYTLISFLIIGVGFFEAVGNETINEFLRTHYVNHYAHIYTIMIQTNKTVTFFATHSIAAYVYLILFMGWEFYSVTYKSKISLICRMGLFIVIVLCKSVSSVLCCGIVVAYYLIKYRAQLSKKTLLVFATLLFAGSIWIIDNFSIIEALLQSEGNGILGRYFGGSSNLSESIKYIFSFGLPTGFYNLDNLRYNDSGYVVYLLRGGIGILIVLDIMLYNLLKRVCVNRIIYRTMFICILLFDVGYAVLISQRFVAALLLVLYFISTCCLASNCEVIKNGNNKSINKKTTNKTQII